MLSNSQLAQVRTVAEEVILREGCLLYDLEFLEGPTRALRVYIDKSEGGVSIDDCANVSRGLNLRLDVEDLISGAYDLEVSSPGLDRKLTQLWHYEKAVEKTLRLQYRDESGQVKPYEGQLMGVKGTELTLENKKGLFSLEFNSVIKARIHLGEAFAKKPMPGKTKKR